jgi:hypothetical protein
MKEPLWSMLITPNFGKQGERVYTQELCDTTANPGKERESTFLSQPKWQQSTGFMVLIKTQGAQ